MRKNWILIGLVLILGCSKTPMVETQLGTKTPGKIVFRSDRFDKKWSTCVLEEGVIKRVYTHGGVSPKWSPNRKKLVIGQYTKPKEFTGLIVIDEKNNKRKYPLDRAPFAIEWLPDSESVIFASNLNGDLQKVASNLFYINFRTQKLNQLTFYDDEKVIQSLSVSPDGKKVIFLRALNEPTNKAALSAEYLIGNFDGGNLTDVKSLPVYPTNSSWSPDGKKIVYTSGYYKGERLLKGYLLMYDFETGEETLVHENKENFIQPTFSPDAKQILVSAWSGLYVMDVDGSNIRQVVPPKNLETFDSHDTHPDWAA